MLSKKLILRKIQDASVYKLILYICEPKWSVGSKRAVALRPAEPFSKNVRKAEAGASARRDIEHRSVASASRGTYSVLSHQVNL